MNKQNVIHFKDWKYVGVEPDADFNADFNKAVIEKTIKHAEMMRRAKRREHQQGVAERAEAIAKYLDSVQQGGKETDVTKYFGKKYQGYLAGKTAMERIKDGLTSIGADGKVIRRPGDIIE